MRVLLDLRLLLTVGQFAILVSELVVRLRLVSAEDHHLDPLSDGGNVVVEAGDLLPVTVNEMDVMRRIERRRQLALLYCHVSVQECLAVLVRIEEPGTIEHAGNPGSAERIGAELVRGDVEGDSIRAPRFELFEIRDQDVVRALVLNELLHIVMDVEARIVSVASTNVGACKNLNRHLWRPRRGRSHRHFSAKGFAAVVQYDRCRDW